MDTLPDRLSWIKDLVHTEEQMENAGIVDLNPQSDREKLLIRESTSVLQYFKNEIVEAAQIFNSLKTSQVGRIKIYNIAKTNSDFMVFRNGFKMIFSMKKPGVISIRFNFIGTLLDASNPTVSAAAAQSAIEENLIETKLGPFGELHWVHKGQAIKLSIVVKHHMTLFVRESSK
jgi:sensor histidine kinase YesM